MLLVPRPILDAMAAGTVTLAFRRGRRQRVRPGTRLRTAVGVLEVTAIAPVAPEAIGDEAERRAGAARPGRPAGGAGRARGHPLPHRAAPRGGRPARGPARAPARPRGARGLRARLARMDAASRRPPWTADLLRLIGERPGQRAADLAAAAGRDTLALKRDVRRLKELGLTESLGTGYRLSPRGRALLERGE